MPRVSQETIEKLNAFIESLPTDARNKCALCNETLTHLVKTAEVETGAGTATVTRVLAEKINETAAPADRVSGKRLEDRARYHDGSDKVGISDNNQITEPYPENEGGEKKAPQKRPAQDMKKLFPLGVISDEFKRSYDKFFDQVLYAKKYNWETTSRESVSQCIKSLNRLIGD